jgi:hypothetical protein
MTNLEDANTGSRLVGKPEEMLVPRHDCSSARRCARADVTAAGRAAVRMVDDGRGRKWDAAPLVPIRGNTGSATTGSAAGCGQGKACYPRTDQFAWRFESAHT